LLTKNIQRVNDFDDLEIAETTALEFFTDVSGAVDEHWVVVWQ
tara:strand:+ start:1306 stop:1434 length:129 start_codon:yes stop_codon:yes gene_type:complete